MSNDTLRAAAEAAIAAFHNCLCRDDDGGLWAGKHGAEELCGAVTSLAHVLFSQEPPAAAPAQGGKHLRKGEPKPPAGPQTPRCESCGGCREWGGNGLWHHAGCNRSPDGTGGAWFEPHPPAEGSQTK